MRRHATALALIAALALPGTAFAATKVPHLGKERMGHHGMIYRGHHKLVKSPNRQMRNEGLMRRDAM